MFVLDYNVWSLAFLLISVCIGICHKIAMLPCYCLGLMLVPFLLCVYIHIFADASGGMSMAALLCLCRYSVLASSGHPATIW